MIGSVYWSGGVCQVSPQSVKASSRRPPSTLEDEAVSPHDTTGRHEERGALELLP